jgi:hypothetical protein
MAALTYHLGRHHCSVISDVHKIFRLPRHKCLPDQVAHNDMREFNRLGWSAPYSVYIVTASGFAHEKVPFPG